MDEETFTTKEPVVEHTLMRAWNMRAHAFP
jgi:hypothetical protein